jgi:hypothetical protein
MYVLADFQERYEIAVRWLYSLLASDRRRSTSKTASGHGGVRKTDSTSSTNNNSLIKLETNDSTSTSMSLGDDGANADTPATTTALVPVTTTPSSASIGQMYENYTAILTSILSGLESALEPSDTLFSTFLVDLPYLPSCVFEALHRYCHNHDTRLLGLSSLRDLVLDRLPARQRALSMLLGNHLPACPFRVLLNMIYLCMSV